MSIKPPEIFRATKWMLLVVSLVFAVSSAAQESDDALISPDSDARSLTAATIDSERFELGFYVGSLSVEDFGTEWLTGLELTYHLGSRWLLQGSYGRSEVDRAAFESGQRRFLRGDERDFEYLSLSAGYHLIHGRSFFGADSRFDSDFYAIAGTERVDFAGEDEWGLVFGLSYRTVFTDWLTANVDIREHWVERDFIGSDKNTLNTEFRVGINALF